MRWVAVAAGMDGAPLPGFEPARRWLYSGGFPVTTGVFDRWGPPWGCWSPLLDFTRFSFIDGRQVVRVEPLCRPAQMLGADVGVAVLGGRHRGVSDDFGDDLDVQARRPHD